MVAYPLFLLFHFVYGDEAVAGGFESFCHQIDLIRIVRLICGILRIKILLMVCDTYKAFVAYLGKSRLDIFYFQTI